MADEFETYQQAQKQVMRKPMKPMKVARFSVDEHHQIRVFIWPDNKTLEGAIGINEVAAYWHSPEIHILDGKIVTKLVSTLHFYIKGFGAGTFAHELQHFIQDWIDIGGIDKEDPEAVPKLAGDLTNKFWIWFYQYFRVDE